MPDLPRPALQVVEITPPEEPGAPRQDGTAPQPSAPAEGARGDRGRGHATLDIRDPVARMLHEKFRRLGEVLVGRGPHG